jgi:hypothetical protein
LTPSTLVPVTIGLLRGGTAEWRHSCAEGFAFVLLEVSCLLRSPERPAHKLRTW